MKPVIGIDVGRQVCKALGIDITGVRTIDMHIAAQEVVTVTVERSCDQVQLGKLVTLLEKYELRQKLVDASTMESAPCP